MKMIKQPTIPPMPKRPTFDARDTQYNLPIGTDCISRQAAIDGINELMKVHFDRKSALGKARTIMQELPPADPQIIRCKDCKNWDTTWTNDFSPNYHYCPMVDGVRKEDWFCADAERRTDE